jgi:type 1 glutamine amidotransferase
MIGKGWVLYSAFGHQAQANSEPEYRMLLTNSITWAAHQQGSECGAPSPAKGL